MFDLLDQVENELASKKVSIVEFAESDEFCDKPLYPRQRVLLKLIFLEELDAWEEDVLDYWIAGGRNGHEVEISPSIRERVAWLKTNGYNHFREVDLVAGRRASKGFITGLAMGKLMWDTLQLGDPGRYYGIDPDKQIYFSCVAGSEAQAKEYQYADFIGAVGSCKAFEPYLARTLETEFRVATSEDLRKMQAAKNRGSKADRDISTLRGKALAANAGTLRGSATMGLVIDEMAHMIIGESKASADEVYKAATPSLDQFGADGMIFCNSSPYSKVGAFYERYTEAMKVYDPAYEPGEPIGPSANNGSPMLMTIRIPSWALFEDYQSDPGRRFRKAITVSPDWNKEDEKHSNEDRRAIVQARATESSNVEAYKVERRGLFAEVTDAYLNPELVDQIFMGIPSGYTSEGRVELAPIPFNFGAGVRNIYKYKFHLDPSSTTAGFGFAIAHTEAFEDNHGRTAEHCVFDLIKRWNPKDFPGETIDWKVVINEVLVLADLFRPYEITMDQFQSAEPVQTLQYALQERGIGSVQVYVKTATLEENWFRAESFKTAMNHGFIHAPIDAIAIDPYGPDQELKFLQEKRTGGRYPRVDKQEIGPVQTKDMADCMMQCVNDLIGNLLATQMRDRAVEAVMATGAQGGFQIGGRQQPSLSELHPNLAGYYASGKRTGEQSGPGYNTTPSPGVVGGGRRGTNRGAGRRSRGRF